MGQDRHLVAGWDPLGTVQVSWWQQQTEQSLLLLCYISQIDVLTVEVSQQIVYKMFLFWGKTSSCCARDSTSNPSSAGAAVQFGDTS